MSVGTNRSKTLELPSVSEKSKIFEIDFIGGETYRVSQNFILQKRSLEPIVHKDSFAALSARGLYHRDKDYFLKELSGSSQLIRSLSKQGLGKKGGSHALYFQFFQRALAFERLKHTDRAIDDYTTAIKNDPSQSQAYFNRAGLYQTQGKFELALKDFNKAVLLEPTNVDYRYSRALLHRRVGDYVHAIQDTVINRAIEVTPAAVKDLEQGFKTLKELNEREKSLKIDTDIVGRFKKTEDPILRAFRQRGGYKPSQLHSIVDFLKNLKFFKKFVQDTDTLMNLASKFQLNSFNKGAFIFNEGDKGNHFFVVLDGEVSIVRQGPDALMRNVLVKLVRGDTFGETALDSKGGLRTAGAMASQPCNLMALHVDDYHRILSQFVSGFKDEVKEVLQGCPVFKDWTVPMIEHLASVAQTLRYSANSNIVKSGESMKYLYIVRSGVVQIVKEIEKPGHPVSVSSTAQTFVNPDTENEREAPGNWVLETNWKKRLGSYGDKEVRKNAMSFVTAIIGSGQVFGELAILAPEIRSPTSAIAYTNVELYSFDSDALLTLGSRYNAVTMNALNESMNMSNPPAEKIAFYYRSKLQWERSKHKLLSRLKDEKKFIA